MVAEPRVIAPPLFPDPPALPDPPRERPDRPRTRPDRPRTRPEGGAAPAAAPASAPAAAPASTTARAVDRYREVIERYDVDALAPVDLLPHRERLIEQLTGDIRPLLDALAEADAADAEVTRLRATLAEGGPMISQVARSRIVRARDRRDLAIATILELARPEATVLRYALLRQLVRATPERDAGSVPR